MATKSATQPFKNPKSQTHKSQQGQKQADDEKSAGSINNDEQGLSNDNNHKRQKEDGSDDNVENVDAASNTKDLIDNNNNQEIDSRDDNSNNNYSEPRGRKVNKTDDAASDADEINDGNADESNADDNQKAPANKKTNERKQKKNEEDDAFEVDEDEDDAEIAETINKRKHSSAKVNNKKSSNVSSSSKQTKSSKELTTNTASQASKRVARTDTKNEPKLKNPVDKSNKPVVGNGDGVKDDANSNDEAEPEVASEVSANANEDEIDNTPLESRIVLGEPIKKQCLYKGYEVQISAIPVRSERDVKEENVGYMTQIISTPLPPASTSKGRRPDMPASFSINIEGQTRIAVFKPYCEKQTPGANGYQLFFPKITQLKEIYAKKIELGSIIPSMPAKADHNIKEVENMQTYTIGEERVYAPVIPPVLFATLLAQNAIEKKTSPLYPEAKKIYMVTKTTAVSTRKSATSNIEPDDDDDDDGAGAAGNNGNGNADNEDDNNANSVAVVDNTNDKEVSQRKQTKKDGVASKKKNNPAVKNTPAPAEISSTKKRANSSISNTTTTTTTTTSTKTATNSEPAKKPESALTAHKNSSNKPVTKNTQEEPDAAENKSKQAKKTPAAKPLKSILNDFEFVAPTDSAVRFLSFYEEKESKLAEAADVYDKVTPQMLKDFEKPTAELSEEVATLKRFYIAAAKMCRVLGMRKRTTPSLFYCD
jgi:hypothetical protein